MWLRFRSEYWAAWAIKISLTPPLLLVFYTKPGKWAVGYLCVRIIYFVCFYDLSFEFWNYSDSVVLLVFSIFTPFLSTIHSKYFVFSFVYWTIWLPAILNSNTEHGISYITYGDTDFEIVILCFPFYCNKYPQYVRKRVSK